MKRGKLHYLFLKFDRLFSSVTTGCYHEQSTNTRTVLCCNNLSILNANISVDIKPLNQCQNKNFVFPNDFSRSCGGLENFEAK